MRTTRSLLTLSALSAVALGGAAAAQAADGDGVVTVTVSAAPALHAGDRSPFDVPGVKAIRRGKPIPAGYVLPGKTVKTEGHGGVVGAAIRFTCPAGKTLRSFASTGAGFSSTRDYVGRRSTFVLSIRPSHTGSLYAVCR